MASVFKRNGQGPWLIRYFDSAGTRREKSSRTTDHRAATRIAAQLDADAALGREGVVDPAHARAADAASRALKDHVADYLLHLDQAGRSSHTVTAATKHLAWIQDKTRATRLAELTLERVTGALAILREQKRSARTVNYYGGSAATFLGWCVRTGRLESNPLRFLPHQAEAIDRRRERRALTDAELVRLFAEAELRGRALWYGLAYWAGLRRSELARLTWGDFDLTRGVIVMRKGKAKRADEIPIHPALRAVLDSNRPRAATPGKELLAGPGARVFPTLPTNLTRQRDFERAGISLEPDEQGRVVDLHSLRATLATNLARLGVAPQLVQKVMRHADYRTTMRAYTVLRIDDTAAALASLSSPTARPVVVDKSG